MENENKEIALVLTGTLPEIAGNFDECKAFYTAELDKYQAVVTAETLTTAKADLAKLRAEIKRLDRIRIDEEKRLKAPITAMAAKVQEITGMVSKTVEQIEKQVKVFEDETRNTCKFLMAAHLATEYDRLEIRQEFRTGDVSPLVGISKMTGKGALTKEARDNVSGLAIQAKACQLRVDGRIASIGAQCLAAGLEAALSAEYFEKFLSESDGIWVSNSARIIALEVARQKAAREAEKKRTQDALAAQQAAADREAREKIEKENRERMALEMAKIEKRKSEEAEKKRLENIEAAKLAAEKRRAEIRAPEAKTITSPGVSASRTPEAPKNIVSGQNIPANDLKKIFQVRLVFEIRAHRADREKILPWLKKQISEFAIPELVSEGIEEIV